MVPESWNSDARTVEVKLTTDTPVLRRPFFGEPYNEILSMDPGAIRLERLNGGPFLTQHNSRDVNSQIGSFVSGSARVEDGALYATVKFTDEDLAEARNVEWLIQEIVRGHRQKVSIGYDIHGYESDGEDDRGVENIRITDWEIYEGSTVMMPADNNAGYRDNERPERRPDDHNQCTNTGDDGVRHAAAPAPIPEPTPRATTDNKETDMSDHTENVTEPVNEPEATITEAEAQRRADEAAERAQIAATERRITIEGVARKLSLDPSSERVQSIVTETVELKSGRKRLITVDEARAKLIDLVADQVDSNPVNSRHSGVQVGDDGRKRFADGVEALLLNRSNPKRYPLANDASGQKARELKGYSLKELAREHLAVNGVRVSGGAHALAERAFAHRTGLHSATDFPQILANVATKSLQDAYDESNSLNYRMFCRQAILPDLKEKKSARLSGAPSLQEVAPGGEYEYGEMLDTAEGYSLAKYGYIIAIDEEVIINDDLDAFTRTPMLIGSAAARKEGDIVWGILTANDTMTETSRALFNATDGNLSGSDADPSVTTIGEALSDMAQFAGLNSETLNIEGRYILVPQTLRLKATQVVGDAGVDIESDTPTNRTPGYMRGMQVIPEARLDSNSTARWYVAADPNQIDTIEYGFLEGMEGVQVETKQGFQIDGIHVKAKLYFAAKALDWRGLYKYGAS